MLADLDRARIVVTNFHAFRRRETLPLSTGGRVLLQGRGAGLRSLETEGPRCCGGLRRQSCDLNEDGRFNVEYADVLGIPFDFTARPVVTPPQPPRKTVHVKAVTPERDACEIRFPRVAGYRVELPEERLSARFDDDSTLELTPDLVGPSKTLNRGIIGEGVDLGLVHTGDLPNPGPESPSRPDVPLAAPRTQRRATGAIIGPCASSTPKGRCARTSTMRSGRWIA